MGYAKAKQTDFDELEAWLTERALEHDKPMLLFTMACEYLYKSKILRPGVVKNTGIVLSKKVVINDSVNYIPNDTNADKRKICVQHILPSSAATVYTINTRKWFFCT